MTELDLASKTPAELIAIITAMARASQKALTLKVSEKGALSVYGFGQWPVTLYASQWRRLLDDAAVAQIKEFMDTHKAVLAEKPVK